MQQNAGIIADPGQQAAYGAAPSAVFINGHAAMGQIGTVSDGTVAGIKKGRRSVPFVSHFEVGEVAFFLQPVAAVFRAFLRQQHVHHP